MRMILVGLIAVAAGCTSVQEGVTCYEKYATRTVFTAKGDYEQVYRVLQGKASIFNRSLGIGNMGAVQTAIHPATQSAEIIPVWSNALMGNSVLLIIRINAIQDTSDRSTVTVLDREKDPLKNPRSMPSLVRKWLEEEAMLIPDTST